MTNRQWLLEQMQNMSDEELAESTELRAFICDKIKYCDADNSDGCKKCKLDWLKAEHKEKTKLSDAERVILENVSEDYKWIARNKSKRINKKRPQA